MEERHKKAIQSNFVSLVETTDLDSMVTALYERGVFSEQMIEPYKVSIYLLFCNTPIISFHYKSKINLADSTFSVFK